MSMGAREAAERLGLKRSSVVRMAQDGRLFGAYKAPDGSWRIPTGTIEHYAATRLGRRGRVRGVKTSSVRRVVELRLRRLGEVRARELAEDCGVTRSLIAHYLREIGARYDTRTGVWRAAVHGQAGGGDGAAAVDSGGGGRAAAGREVAVDQSALRRGGDRGVDARSGLDALARAANI